MRLIVVTGMPGAGKSEIATQYAEKGYPIIVMGDIIRKETRDRGLEPNSQNTRMIMLDIRKKDGLGAVAKRCIKELERMRYETIVIEGCRSIAELDIFNEFSKDVIVICAHASPKSRFERLQVRARQDAPVTWEAFRERDLREISVGLGGIIALSDVMIVNETSLQNFTNEVKEIVRRFG